MIFGKKRLLKKNREFFSKSLAIVAIFFLAMGPTVRMAGADAQPTFTSDKSDYLTTDQWTLNLSSAPANQTVVVCAIIDSGALSCSLASDLGLAPSTDDSGSWTATGGGFSDSQTGSWQEWINIGGALSGGVISGGVESNHISFTVREPAAASAITVITAVTNNSFGGKSVSDFVDVVTGTNVSPASTFPGSASGNTVTLYSGSYSVTQNPASGYAVMYSAGCSGTVAAGETKTCTITDNEKPLPAPICSVNGLYGVYNNLPGDHPNVENGAILGVTSGTTPFQYDWYSPKYFSFATTTPISSFNQPSDFFPVNDGLPNDPFDTAIHWTGWVNFPAAGTYPITLGSDDDSWLYIGGNLITAVPGPHVLEYANNTSITVNAAGTSPIDLYFAERRVTQSGLVFRVSGATFSPCEPTSTISSADLSIAKSVDAASPQSGDTVHYALSVTALGPSTSTAVAVTDSLPVGLSFVSATSSVGSYAASTGIWTIGSIAPSSTATLTIAATVNAAPGASVTNTATVRQDASLIDPNTANNTASSTLVVRNSTGSLYADISVAKTVDNPIPRGGDTVTYKVTVSALGPSPSTYIAVHDQLPTGLSLISATTSQGLYSLGTGNWNVGDLNANATATLKVSAIVDPRVSSQTIVNTATVSELSSLVDSNTANNSSSVSIAVVSSSTPFLANLGVTKTVDNPSPSTGDVVHYLISVSDNGPASSTNVVATDTIPIGLTFVNATTSQGTYASTTGTWFIGNMQVSSTATLAIAVQVNAPSGTTIVNTVNVEGAPDPSASATLTVATPPVPPVNPPVTPPGVVGVGGGGMYYNFDLKINDGARSTATTTVALKLTATGANRMWISNDPAFPSGDWVPFSATYPWVLTSGNGMKTVYARYANGSTTLATVQAGIELVGSGTGQVLGASTSCGIYLKTFIKRGAKNDPEDVKRLQVFLNANLGKNIPVTGFYGDETFKAVEEFQVKYSLFVLAPWVPYGLHDDKTSTGYVYKTTQRWINILNCPSLNLPMPYLP